MRHNLSSMLCGVGPATSRLVASLRVDFRRSIPLRFDNASSGAPVPGVPSGTETLSPGVRAAEATLSGSKRVSRVGISIQTMSPEKRVKKTVQTIEPVRKIL